MAETLDYARPGASEADRALLQAAARQRPPSRRARRLQWGCCGAFLWGSAALPGGLAVMFLALVVGFWLYAVTLRWSLWGQYLRRRAGLEHLEDEGASWRWLALSATMLLFSLGVPARLAFLLAMPALDHQYTVEPHFEPPPALWFYGPILATAAVKDTASGVSLWPLGGGIVQYEFDARGRVQGRVMFTPIGPPLLTGRGEPGTTVPAGLTPWGL